MQNDKTLKTEVPRANVCFSEQTNYVKNRLKNQAFCKDCPDFTCEEIDEGKILRLKCSLFNEYREPYDDACLFFNAKFELTCNECAYLMIVPRPRKDKVFCWLDGEKATIAQRVCHNFCEGIYE